MLVKPYRPGHRWTGPLLLLLLLTTLVGCEQQPATLQHGQPTPGFRLPTLADGEARFPEDYPGQTVAIRFWADWCPFCEHEMQALEPVYLRYRNQGLRLLAINVRQDRQRAMKFVQPLGITYPVLLDQEGSVARAYGVSALPVTYLVDGQGLLRGRILGESTPEVFEQLVKETMVRR